MLKLEDIKQGAQIKGLSPNEVTTISVAEMVGDNAVSIIYKLPDGSIKERMVSRDDERVLIVSPGSLTEQWQDEMREKFTIGFKIFSREMQENSATGNFFPDEDLLIARLDQLARHRCRQHGLC